MTSIKLPTHPAQISVLPLGSRWALEQAAEVPVAARREPLRVGDRHRHRTGPAAVQMLVVAVRVGARAEHHEQAGAEPVRVENAATAAEALTEPRGGSDFFGASSVAEDRGDHFVVRGMKRFIVGAEGADECAAAVRGQLALGADAVIMHGASPDELAPIVDAYADS